MWVWPETLRVDKPAGLSATGCIKVLVTLLGHQELGDRASEGTAAMLLTSTDIELRSTAMIDETGPPTWVEAANVIPLSPHRERLVQGD